MGAGDVTGEDVMSVLPFNNTVDLVQLSGHQILSLLEYNVAGLCPNMSCETVEFYQVSGMRLVFDIRENNQVFFVRFHQISPLEISKNRIGTSECF